MTLHTSMSANESIESERMRIGLCAGCRHMRRVHSERGSNFYLCEKGLKSEPGFAKYPRLPVLKCSGFETDEIHHGEANAQSEDA
jgi:hypothetical protein